MNEFFGGSQSFKFAIGGSTNEPIFGQLLLLLCLGSKDFKVKAILFWNPRLLLSFSHLFELVRFQHLQCKLAWQVVLRRLVSGTCVVQQMLCILLAEAWLNFLSDGCIQITLLLLNCWRGLLAILDHFFELLSSSFCKPAENCLEIFSAAWLLSLLKWERLHPFIVLKISGGSRLLKYLIAPASLRCDVLCNHHLLVRAFDLRIVGCREVKAHCVVYFDIACFIEDPVRGVMRLGSNRRRFLPRRRLPELVLNRVLWRLLRSRIVDGLSCTLLLICWEQYRFVVLLGRRLKFLGLDRFGRTLEETVSLLTLCVVVA